MRLAIVLFILTVGAPAAFAVLPPKVYKEARDTAKVHVVIDVKKVETPKSTPGGCAVSGTVFKLHRDKTNSLKTGQTLTFDVSCMKKGDEIPKGGVLWKNVDKLQRATRLEAISTPQRGASRSPVRNRKSSRPLPAQRSRRRQKPRRTPRRAPSRTTTRETKRRRPRAPRAADAALPAHQRTRLGRAG